MKTQVLLHLRARLWHKMETKVERLFSLGMVLELYGFSGRIAVPFFRLQRRYCI